jgi:hypothetical protein
MVGDEATGTLMVDPDESTTETVVWVTDDGVVDGTNEPAYCDVTE